MIKVGLNASKAPNTNNNNNNNQNMSYQSINPILEATNSNDVDLAAELKYLKPQDHKGAVSDSATQADWTAKKYVWVPDDNEGFVRASVKQELGEECLCVLDNGKQIKVPKDDIQRMNPPKFSKVEDMAELTCLNEASVLYNLKDRYYSGLIYTYSGLFCVVVNPYKNLPIYTENIVDLYKGKKRHEMPPHVFAIADKAYRSMLTEREDQSILCTGESGAGKTENTKKVIQYLAHVAAKASTKTTGHLRDAGELESQLLQANPILEAFGNAKTVKNDNSSRFGKFIRINFDQSGFIAGANIETYLLEKSRAIRQAKEERTFHIFYQLLKGASAKDRQEYLLDDLKSYNYLSNPYIPIQGVDEVEEYNNTIKAMHIMGINNEDIISIVRTVSGVLQMGNLQFKQERQSEQATLPDNTVAQKVCYLFGLNVTDFTRSLLKPKLKVGRDFVTKAQNKEQVEFAVEAIAKAIYERMFKWIVQRINKSLDRSKRQGASFIGILDIAGFEIFQLNSFEQLCINYTNEKLQQLFNHTMFILEQEEYKREGLEWKYIDFGLDLQPTIDLIEKPMGILSLLDEECLFPKATDRTYCDKLNASHSLHPKFGKPSFKSTYDFSIIHYAGKVDYSADQWLMKNMDPLNDNIVALLQASSDSFTREIWKDAEIVGMAVTEGADNPTFGQRTKKGMFRTVGQLYKEQLFKLMSTLRNTNPNFVRCIIPNHEKRAGKIDSPLVLDQLRCNGVLEGIRICRQGFPNRIPFQEFRQRYEILCPNVIPKGFMDAKLACEKMIKDLELDENLFRVGQSKLFFRAGVLAHLEEERDMKLTDVIIQLQAVCRGVLARKNYQKKIQQVNAMRIIQRNGRAFLKLKNWHWWRLFTKIKPLLQVTRQDEEIFKREEEIKKFKSEYDKQISQFKELEQRSTTLMQEKLLLAEQLQQEIESHAETEETKNRTLARKQELEEMLQDYLGKLEDSETRIQDAVIERKKLQQNIQDLTEQLEEEEQIRQKYQLEKHHFENKLKTLEQDLAIQAELSTKFGKEKKQLEDKLHDVLIMQTEDGEKIKQLLKLKSKFESQVSDLEERLRKEIELRQKLERSMRQMEIELAETRDQLNERNLQVNELQTQLQKREQELTTVFTKSEEEANMRTSIQRELREYQSQVQDLREDLESEREARKRAEKEKRDLMEEVESLRNEITDQNDTSSVMQEQFKKQNDEVYILKRKLEDENQHKEQIVAELKLRFNKQIEELNTQIDNLRKNTSQVSKLKQSLEAENVDLANEVKNLNQLKSDSERKRKALEASVQDLNHKLNDSERQKAEVAEKLQKFQAENEQFRTITIDNESRTSQIEKNIQALKSQLLEAQEANQEEIRQKLALQAKLRQIEDENNQLRENLEEKNEKEEKFKLQVKQLQDQQSAYKKQNESDRAELEQVEELKRKYQKDLEQLERELDESKALSDKLDKSKKKLQNDYADLTVELDKFKTMYITLEKQQKNFDKKLTEEKTLREQLMSEKESVERDSREKETRLLQLQRENDEKNEILSEMDKKYKQLKLAYDDTLSHKDDVGKNVHELEKSKRLLEAQLEEQRIHIEELEDELQATEDAKLRLEVTQQAIKAQLEKKLQESSDLSEEKFKSLMKQIRDLEADLDDERKQRTTAVNMKKKFELDFNDLKGQLDESNRIKDEQFKQIKRLTQNVKEITRECEELRLAKEEIISGGKEWEKKLKSFELQIMQLQEEKDAAERLKKQACLERDELQHEFDSVISGKNATSEEKRRLEAKITELEEELEEEQTNAEVSNEKMRKLQIDLDKLNTDLLNEKSNTLKAENAKILIEKQNKELKEKVEELEESAKGRSKAVISSLELKIAAIEEQLHMEANEKQRIAREYKKAERKIKDLQMQIDEERKQTDSYKEQADRIQSKLKANKRVIDDKEEEINQMRVRNRKATRDIEELNEQIEVLTREIATLRTRQSRITGSTVRTDITTRVRQSNSINRMLSETQDMDDEDLDNTFTSHHHNVVGNGGLSLTSGANGSHSSLSTISSNKESPTS
ncbi:unnamed protein product [Brachionus calyciflorus]|uniref:Uncharacterized protein n=1 Tax=Brachionus calyciflorus TaxID=104777 RepID=A0A814AI25_9BILA|nr:unnamed protein product [Brachionus calyciflorus]